MRITDIKVFPVREEKLKAFISIVLDECFMVNDIKVIKGKEGFFISMPSRRKRNGKFKDIAHPLNNETRQAMEKEILAAYEGALGGVREERSGVRARPTGGAGAESAPSEQRAAEPRASEAKTDEPRALESERVAKAEPYRPEAPARPSAQGDVQGAVQGAVGESVTEGDGESASEPEADDKSLDEVTELHLRDSFWGT